MNRSSSYAPETGQIPSHGNPASARTQPQLPSQCLKSQLHPQRAWFQDGTKMNRTRQDCPCSRFASIATTHKLAVAVGMVHSVAIICTACVESASEVGLGPRSIRAVAEPGCFNRWRPEAPQGQEQAKSRGRSAAIQDIEFWGLG